MPGLRSAIEGALDDFISDEEGMRFQGLAVILAKMRWPDLIGSERKRDLGADAIAKAPFAAEGGGKVLACSTTATLAKIEKDALRIKDNYKGIDKLIFATPDTVSNELQEQWAAEIEKNFGYSLAVMEREDFITSLMMPSNASLLQTFVGWTAQLTPDLVEDIQKVRTAASEITDVWRERIHESHLIELRAQRLDKAGRAVDELFRVAEIHEAVSRGDRVILEGPAGRGKTTTLVQLAKSFEGKTGIPILVDLPSWAASGQPIVQFIAGMPQFQRRGITAETLSRVIQSEPIAFLFNGWNEVGEEEYRRADRALRNTERDFPAVSMIVATRAHRIAPPLAGAVRMQLQPITRTERSEYLGARLRNQFESLRRQLDFNVALDALTRTPLILSAVATLHQHGSSIPETKLGVLSALAKHVESGEEHRSALLQEPLWGFASAYLEELAVRMTSHGAVIIGERDARIAVVEVGEALKNDNQIGSVPDPTAVLTALSSHHLLERRDYPEPIYVFQHQQFQEFYAALRVQKELSKVVHAEAVDVRRTFLEKYVNAPAWAEPLRMIADDLRHRREDSSTTSECIRTGSVLVEMALQVDPIFASELARRCGPRVWNRVGATVGKRLRALLSAPYSVYEEIAIAGMVATGSSDFKDVVEPKISSADPNLMFQVYRRWNEFHLSTLGSNWSATVRGWKDPARKAFVAEIVSNGQGSQIIDFIKNDPSEEVKKAAIERLTWMGADDDALELIEALDEESSEKILPQLDADLVPAGARSKVLASTKTEFAGTTEPFLRLRSLIRQTELGESVGATLLKQELNGITQKIDDHHIYYAVKPALEILRINEPDWVSAWVAERIVSGALWKKHWEGYLTKLPHKMREELYTRLRTQVLDVLKRDFIASFLAIGSDIDFTKQVIKDLYRLRKEKEGVDSTRERELRELGSQLEALLSNIPAGISLAALSDTLTHKSEPLGLDIVCSAFSTVGRSTPSKLQELDEAAREPLREYLKSSVSMAIQVDDTGKLGADLGSVLAEVGTPAEVKDLLLIIRADIKRLRVRRKANPTDRKPVYSYTNWLVRALAKLDCNESDSGLIELLAEPEYERDVAAQFAEVCRRPKKQKWSDRKLQFERIWEARSGKLDREISDDRRKRYAEALKQQLQTLQRERETVGSNRWLESRLRVLAASLAAVAGSEEQSVILSVMELPADWESALRIDALETLLFEGVTLPIRETVEIIDSVISTYRKNGLDQQAMWTLRRAMCLLPFVDDCDKGIEALLTRMANLKFPTFELDEIVSALGQSRCPAALRALQEIGSDPKRRGELGETWIRSVIDVDSLESRELLLGFADPERTELIHEVSFRRTDLVSSQLAMFARNDERVEQKLFEFCTRPLPHAKRNLLAKTMGDIGTNEAILAALNLIDDDTNPSIPSSLVEVLEDLFVEKRPAGENSFTLTPRSGGDVRTQLYKLAKTDPRRRESAHAILAQIEKWRLEYGRPDSEPRHPVPLSDEAWPSIIESEP